VKARRRRVRAATLAPPPPSVPDLVQAPELAAIILLEHTLAVVRDALVAEHPTLIDDLMRPREQGAVVLLAHLICHREATLREILRRYRRAVRDAAMPLPEGSSNDELF
jgi:hypothetical protein